MTVSPNMLVDVEPRKLLPLDWDPGRDGTPVLLTIVYVQGDSSYIEIRRLVKEMPEWTEENIRLAIDALTYWQGQVTTRNEDGDEEPAPPPKAPPLSPVALAARLNDMETRLLALNNCQVELQQDVSFVRAELQRRAAPGEEDGRALLRIVEENLRDSIKVQAGRHARIRSRLSAIESRLTELEQDGAGD